LKVTSRVDVRNAKKCKDHLTGRNPTPLGRFLEYWINIQARTGNYVLLKSKQEDGEQCDLIMPTHGYPFEMS